MENFTKSLFLLLSLSLLGACDRVKDKEAVADLPKTSVEDTLVLAPDTLEIDTTLTETDFGPGQEDQAARYGEENYREPAAGSESATASAGNASAETRTSQSSAGSTTPVVASGATASGKSAETAKSTGTAPARKKYVRPSRAQLQRSLAADARRSNRLDLPQLKNYWLTRQHYYRRASKEVKYVAGDTKIKISPEETKIETPRGKVKIEGSDIKVKYD
ncbi:hypothetical protein ACD591_01295 [Rufibacter glacialis]|uniref:Uncharacterized protein n=1 Tax=Rufibacter glacialis TaxID=1259555 RepID=A0A5M8QMU0_9BACT|nr:hypothetical protein [Rufibacter glacialis]KAA6435532.1 hypothetical protein FOE74_06195 [Rufibacter glacialis]GGK64337.1 hypothetical protein GCM10011405_10380 [Rufibacter glacialis]